MGSLVFTSEMQREPELEMHHCGTTSHCRAVSKWCEDFCSPGASKHSTTWDPTALSFTCLTTRLSEAIRQEPRPGPSARGERKRRGGRRLRSSLSWRTMDNNGDLPHKVTDALQEHASRIQNETSQATSRHHHSEDHQQEEKLLSPTL